VELLTVAEGFRFHSPVPSRGITDNITAASKIYSSYLLKQKARDNDVVLSILKSGQDKEDEVVLHGLIPPPAAPTLIAGTGRSFRYE
jgi:hypothetical protein